MGITNNILSAYFAGKTTIDEDRMILDSMSESEEFSDMMDLMTEIDSMDEIKEMRHEFNENIDFNTDYNDYNINIK